MEQTFLDQYDLPKFEASYLETKLRQKAMDAAVEYCKTNHTDSPTYILQRFIAAVLRPLESIEK
jgi:hypothetical protein